MSLSGRLFDAADWLSEDIPANTPLIQHLEGDVRLDELDLYCVALMREAAEFVLSTEARATAGPAGGGGDQGRLRPDGVSHPAVDGEAWEPLNAATVSRVQGGDTILVRLKVLAGPRNDYRGLYYVRCADSFPDPEAPAEFTIVDAGDIVGRMPALPKDDGANQTTPPEERS